MNESGGSIITPWYETGNSEAADSGTIRTVQITKMSFLITRCRWLITRGGWLARDYMAVLQLLPNLSVRNENFQKVKRTESAWNYLQFEYPFNFPNFWDFWSSWWRTYNMHCPNPNLQRCWTRCLSLVCVQYCPHNFRWEPEFILRCGITVKNVLVKSGAGTNMLPKFPNLVVECNRTSSD